MPIEYTFCFICGEQCINIISSRKKCGYSSKIISNNATPTFQEVCGGGGGTLLLTCCRWHNNFSPSQY